VSELILYTSDDGQTQLHLRAESHSVWLSQLEISELFQTSKQNVSLHAKNIFADGELHQGSVVKEFLTTASGGKSYRTKLYNLDLILAIGYRVRSPRGVQFRQWASAHLKEFLLKGFVMDDGRLKNPGGGITSMNCWNASARFRHRRSGSIGKCAITLFSVQIIGPERETSIFCRG